MSISATIRVALALVNVVVCVVNVVAVDFVVVVFAVAVLIVVIFPLSATQRILHVTAFVSPP